MPRAEKRAGIPAGRLAALSCVNAFLLEAGLATASQTLLLELGARLPEPCKRSKLYLLLMETLRKRKTDEPITPPISNEEEIEVLAERTRKVVINEDEERCASSESSDTGSEEEKEEEEEGRNDDKGKDAHASSKGAGPESKAGPMRLGKSAQLGAQRLGGRRAGGWGGAGAVGLVRGIEEGRVGSADKIAFASAQPLVQLKGHRQPLTQLQYIKSSTLGSSSSTTCLFSASRDNYMRLWANPKDGSDGSPECVAMSKGPEGMNKAISLEGGSLACLCADGGVVQIVDVVNGRAVDEMRWNEGVDNFSTLAVHEEIQHTLTAVAERENCVLLWDSRKRDPCMRLQRSKTIRGLASELVFADGGASLLCHGSSSSVVWDLRAQQIATTIQTRLPDGASPSGVSVLQSANLLLCEYASAHPPRHSPPAPTHMKLFSLAGGDEKWEFGTRYGSPFGSDGALVRCNHAVSACGKLVLQPVQGGRVCVTRAHAGEHVCVAGRVGGGKQGGLGGGEIGFVAWNPNPYASHRGDVIGSSVWATADVSGKILVWGTPSEDDNEEEGR